MTLISITLIILVGIGTQIILLIRDRLELSNVIHDIIQHSFMILGLIVMIFGPMIIVDSIEENNISKLTILLFPITILVVNIFVIVTLDKYLKIYFDQGTSILIGIAGLYMVIGGLIHINDLRLPLLILMTLLCVYIFLVLIKNSPTNIEQFIFVLISLIILDMVYLQYFINTLEIISDDSMQSSLGWKNIMHYFIFGMNFLLIMKQFSLLFGLFSGEKEPAFSGLRRSFQIYNEFYLEKMHLRLKKFSVFIILPISLSGLINMIYPVISNMNFMGILLILASLLSTNSMRQFFYEINEETNEESSNIVK